MMIDLKLGDYNLLHQVLDPIQIKHVHMLSSDNHLDNLMLGIKEKLYILLIMEYFL